MIRHCHSALILITLLVLAFVVQAQEINMFNGRDLTGWAGLKEFWSVKDGAITARSTKNSPKGNTFLVWQGGEVSDFEFSCKYKLTEQNPDGKANSGIQFRATITDSAKFGMHGYQAEMDNGTNHPPAWPDTPTINGIITDDPPGIPFGTIGQRTEVDAGPDGQPANVKVVGMLGQANVLAGGFRKNQWNDFRIVAIGNHLSVWVNGMQTVDVIDLGNRHRSGLLGLQLHAPQIAKTIQFKDLKLKQLSGSVASSAVAPSIVQSIQTDPNQPRLDVLKDQAPNATEWALAPLEEALPPNIRQNLTYLREDLLDEYKQKPKASQDAYKLAHQLCTSILTTLDERDQARVRAGLRSVQADAGIVGTNQALEARRNYMMSWPQYAREQAQRAELIRQGTAAAQVGKEIPKVEWSNRASALRKALDDLYAKFREELRQSAK